MRIIHFLNNIDLSWYNMLVDTLRAQERRGHEVRIVVPPGGVNYKRLAAEGLNATALPVRSSKLDYYAALKLSAMLREWRADVLHAHLTSGALLGSAAARWAKIPCVASVLKITKKRHYMRCNMLLPCSGAVLDDLLAQGVPSSMMRRVYTGVDIGRVLAGRDENSDARAEWNFTREHKVIGSIARLAPMKGHTHLLDAMAIVAKRIPEARLLLVGDGELRQELENKTVALGLDNVVTFTGTRNDLANILNAIDISVLASVEKEGLPIILVESCLFEKPVVMSDVAGISEIVRDGVTGRLVPPKSPGPLADAICDTLGDGGKARGMAAAAYELVRREFDVDNTTAQLDEVYGQLLRGRAGEK